MTRRICRRCAVTLVLCAALLAPVAGLPLVGRAAPGDGSPAASPARPVPGGPVTTTAADDAGKIQTALRSLVVAAQRAGEAIPVNVAIKSAAPLDLSRLAERAAGTAWLGGGYVTLARIDARHLPKVAGLDVVELIEDAAHPVLTTDEWLHPDRSAQADPPALRDRIADLRRHEVPFAAAPPLATLEQVPDEHGRGAAGDAVDRMVPADPSIDAWMDVQVGHGTARAWARGWRGEGVRVGVSDSGVDFATPALQGTWAVITDTESPYNGWPQALEAQGLYLYVQDAQLATEDAELGLGGVLKMAQTSRATRTWDGRNEPVGRACFKRVLSGNERDEAAQCDYRVPWRSASGVYRFGVHPDPNLVSVYGERPGVLLVDQARSGTYDTVYVDLDNDHDFTDEKPTTKADPLIYRDMDGDGWVDLSGGLLYWIADGRHVPPGGYLWGDLTPVPAQGEVVAIIGTFSGHHGNECASNIVGQPNVPVPDGVDLRFGDLPGDGTPPTLLVGAAPEARLVGIRRGGSLVTESTYLYAAYGHEKDRAGDELQILSNSYPLVNVFEEGWDNASRLLDYLTTVNPNLSFVFSSGNGGPGYGSMRDPDARTAIKVAASTQTGSSGQDSVTTTAQIPWGDIISFSSNGPGAAATIGPHIAANGAEGTGAVGVNARLDGRRTTITWGGTSRSTPVVAGNLALTYQAFRAARGRWPTWQEARGVLMAGAQFMGYDPFIGGAGVVDGGQSALIAGGLDGVWASPEVIEPGDYRGTVYRSFPRLVGRGETRRVTVTLTNPSPQPVELDLAARTMRRIGSEAFEWHSREVVTESAYFFEHPDYVVPLERAKIPPGTELMAVRVVWPLEEADLQLNYSYSSSSDNLWYVRVYQHTDVDGDGVWWDDRDGDGVVDHARLSTSTQLDGTYDTNWAATELDRWEFARLGEDTSPTNNKVMWVHHPLERWADGLYLGLIHRGRPAAMPVTTLQVRLDFYRYTDWPWLALDDARVTVPPGGELLVPLTVTVPVDAAYGYHQGALFGRYTAERPGASPYHRLTVPILVNVAAVLDVPPRPLLGETVYLPVGVRNMAIGPSVEGAGGGGSGASLAPLALAAAPDAVPTFGGLGADDADLPYPNGLVRGANRWGYGNESGDWRFFFLDVPYPAVPGTRLVLRSGWDDVRATMPDGETVPRSDIDTLVYGPVADRWSERRHPDNADENLAHPEWFGPATVEQVGASVLNGAGGLWRFQTVTGDHEEWVAAPVRAGLNVVMAHHTLLAGRSFEVPFSLTVDRARLWPEYLVSAGSGCRAVTLETSFDIDALVAEAYGLSAPERLTRQVVLQDDPNAPRSASWTRTFQVEHAARIEIAIDGAAGDDLDLFLYRDADGDGAFETEVARSTSPEADETVVVRFPEDGDYQIGVLGWSVPSGVTTFDFYLSAIQGRGIEVRGIPTGAVRAGDAVTLQVCPLPRAADDPPLVGAQGEVVLGPDRAPGLFTVPVYVFGRE